MMSRVNGNSVWMDDSGGGDEDDGASWSRSHLTAAGDKDELGLASFKSMLEDDWYMGGSGGGGSASTAAFDAPSVAFPTDQHLPPPATAAATLLPPHVDSSSSCSPTSGFNLDPSQPFFASKTGLSSLLSSVCSTPFEPYEAQQPLFGMTNSLFGLSGQMGCPDLSPVAQFPISGLPPPQGGATTSTGFENSAFINRSKVIRPLEIFPPVGAQPTLFQKRAARQNSSSGSLGLLGFGLGSGVKRRGSEEDEFDEASFDGSGLNYDSDEAAETGKGEGSDKNGGGEGNNSNGNSTVTGGGDQKGKKKGLPAKNLMAERRRRKKLNDRLYMLRSVVPKISKMDRASILGDAIEYLKELLQRINDLHNELESTPSSSITTPNSSNFHPLTPTPPTLPCRVKEELCQSLLPSPSSQTPKVEVRLREGRAVNVHMFCNRKPGLLISTMRALDNLGLDIQQAVISCFNGFALDVFRAEQSKDGPNALPEEIKAVLLQAAGFHSM